MTVVQTFSIGSSRADKIKKKAEHSGKSMSYVVREAIDAYFKNNNNKKNE